MTAVLNQGVSIIGSGRVATSLAHALQSTSICINEVYSRTLERAEKLVVNIPKAKPTDSLDFSSSQSGIFIVAVNDDAINAIAQNIKVRADSYLFHTSGTVSMQTLSGAGSSFGIFYPLQTFVADSKIDFQKIPILIEGGNSEALAILNTMGQAISKQVHEVSESDRQRLHVAAVFASNFTNRMLAAAEDILSNSNLDLHILKPLLEQSIQNAFNQGPDAALTGPAKRGDGKTIEKHLLMLKDKPELLEIYQQVTKFIILKFSNQN